MHTAELNKATVHYLGDNGLPLARVPLEQVSGLCCLFDTIDPAVQLLMSGCLAPSNLSGHDSDVAVSESVPEGRSSHR